MLQQNSMVLYMLLEDMTGTITWSKLYHTYRSFSAIKSGDDTFHMSTIFLISTVFSKKLRCLYIPTCTFFEMRTLMYFTSTEKCYCIIKLRLFAICKTVYSSSFMLYYPAASFLLAVTSGLLKDLIPENIPGQKSEV